MKHKIKQQVLTERVQLDWSNPEHRKMWIEHIQVGALTGMVKQLATQGPLGALAASMIEPGVMELHTQIWEETYQVYPALRDCSITFDVMEGYFDNTPPEE